MPGPFLVAGAIRVYFNLAFADDFDVIDSDEESGVSINDDTGDGKSRVHINVDADDEKSRMYTDDDADDDEDVSKTSLLVASTTM